jgi:predicted CXXCH cytochrome family protein
MNWLLIYAGIFIFSGLFNVSYLQCGEVSDIQPEGRLNISFSEVHGWPGGRCSICHISSRPDDESAALNDSDLSRLCESCHSGTVSILPSSRLKSEVRKMANHPVKFSPLDFDPGKINHVIIEEKNRFYISGKTGKLPIFGVTSATAVAECTTCHDAHNKSDMPNMPRINSPKGELCLVCHLNIEISNSASHTAGDVRR